MNINEIIEAWDKKNLPTNKAKLDKMLALVEFTGDYASHARTNCEERESREMYYYTHVLMTEISHSIRQQLQII